jgi:ketosteroid isomerase-like protein
MLAPQETIAQYAAAINAMSADDFVDCFAESCELHDPVGAPPARGHAGARAFFEGIAGLLATVRFSVNRAIQVNGDQAAFAWRMEATGRNGQTATAEGIDVFVFNAEGKILRSNGYWNPSPFVGPLLS